MSERDGISESVLRDRLPRCLQGAALPAFQQSANVTRAKIRSVEQSKDWTDEGAYDFRQFRIEGRKSDGYLHTPAINLAAPRGAEIDAGIGIGDLAALEACVVD